MSDSLRPRGLQHARPPCPSPAPGVYSNSCPLSRWCHPTISSSVVPFSSGLQSFPASGSFRMSQFFASGSQSIILGLGQILSKPAFICHFCPTLPRTLALLAVTVTGGRWWWYGLLGHNSTKSTCVGEKPFPWELIAPKSILWPTRIDCRNTRVFLNLEVLLKYYHINRSSKKMQMVILWILKEHLIKLSVLFWSKFL